MRCATLDAQNLKFKLKKRFEIQHVKKKQTCGKSSKDISSDMLAQNKKMVAHMRRNGGTTIFSSNSIVLLGDRGTANLTSM